jgi:hypothetical protein
MEFVMEDYDKATKFDGEYDNIDHVLNFRE